MEALPRGDASQATCSVALRIVVEAAKGDTGTVTYVHAVPFLGRVRIRVRNVLVLHGTNVAEPQRRCAATERADRASPYRNAFVRSWTATSAALLEKDIRAAEVLELERKMIEAFRFDLHELEGLWALKVVTLAATLAASQQRPAPVTIASSNRTTTSLFLDQWLPSDPS